MARYEITLRATTELTRTVEADSLDEAVGVAGEQVYDEVIEVDRSKWVVSGAEWLP